MLRSLLALSSAFVFTSALHAAGLTVSVGANEPAQPVSQRIYGVSAKVVDDLPKDAGYTWYRLGGNRITAYNWETNDSNAGKDWKHQSDEWAGKRKTGALVEKHIEETRDRKVPECLTIQMGDWLAADRDGPVIPGTPLERRFVRNRITARGPIPSSPNLKDREVCQEEFLNWVLRKRPASKASPADELYLCLDNEPDLWNSTHALIFPQKQTYADLMRRSFETARMIRRVAPQSVIMGPASFGWHGYSTLKDAPDRNGRDFLSFYMEEMSAESARAGTRLLDALSVHFYSEAKGGGTRVVFEEHSPTKAHLSPACIQARLHAPRSLWDPSYVEQSWITENNGGKSLLLIPSLRERIARCYPGTALAFNEYNFGGGDHISGALALIDALGIFGREKVDYACLWPEGPEAWHHAAMRFLRNYDGKGAAIGEAMLPLSSSDSADFSTYAYRADRGGIQVLVLNKRNSAQSLDLALKGLPKFKTLRRYVLDASSAPNAKKAPVHRLEKSPALSPSAPRLNVPLPPMSATLLVWE